MERIVSAHGMPGEGVTIEISGTEDEIYGLMATLLLAIAGSHIGKGSVKKTAKYLCRIIKQALEEGQRPIDNMTVVRIPGKVREVIERRKEEPDGD